MIIAKIKEFVVSLASRKLLAWLTGTLMVQSNPGLEPNIKAGLEAVMTIIYIIAQALIDRKVKGNTILADVLAKKNVVAAPRSEGADLNALLK